MTLDGKELLCGVVTGAGGGVVDILVDRDTESYPNLGDEVEINAKDTIKSLRAEVHKLTGRIIHAENTLGVIAQDGAANPVAYALDYFGGAK